MEKTEAIQKLWELGNLEWKLMGVQKDMRKAVYDRTTSKNTVFLCSRRLGKSFTMLCIALEFCIKNPGSIVKILFPKKKDAKMVSKFQMKTILADCPAHIKPEWKEADKLYEFPNGSEIQMAGTDGGSAESVRGSACHLAILDEAGFHDYNDFTYIVRSIIVPTLLTTNGKMIMASTPSKEPDHPFMTEYVKIAKENESLIEYDIYSNPLISEDQIEEIANEFPSGKEDPDFKREFLLETNVQYSNTIIPEFTQDVRKICVTPEVDEKPEFYDFYVSGDPAVTDLTVILFAYYDYLKKRLCIVDEFVAGGDGGQTVTTLQIAQGIRTKERQHFTYDITNEVKTPYMRIMDNNNKFLLNDLITEHGLQFVATAKDNKEAQINKLRLLVAQKQVYIHPRCENLIFHLISGRWNKYRTGFDRSKGETSRGLSPHHCDAIDALIYLARNVNFQKDPYPDHYFKKQGTHIFDPSEHNRPKSDTFIHKLMNIRKKT